MAYVEFPILFPFNVVDKNRELPTNYNFKHFDDWLDVEQQLEVQMRNYYYQKWQNDDIAFCQVKSDFDPIRIKVRKYGGPVILTHLMNRVLTNNVDSWYEDQIAFDMFDEGIYQAEFYAGDPIQNKIVSEPFYVKQNWPDTMLFNFWSNFNTNVMWETGIRMNFRCEAVLPLKNPASVRTVYIDQPQNAITVKGDPYRLLSLVVGQTGGVPNWVIDKLEEIIDQNNVSADGKFFSAIPDASWNIIKSDSRFPWAGWNIDVREVNNNRAKRFESSGLQDQKIAMDYVIEGSLFGPTFGPINDNSYTINALQ